MSLLGVDIYIMVCNGNRVDICIYQIKELVVIKKKRSFL